MRRRVVKQPYKPVPMERLDEQVQLWRSGQITAALAAAALGISRTTFFRRVKAQKQEIAE